MTRVKSDPEHVDPLHRVAAGGRRKQSKPIRVFNVDPDSANNAPVAEGAMADEAPADADVDMDVGEAPAMDLGYDMSVQNGDCNANNDMSAFPTKYHALGSVLLESSLGFNSQRLRHEADEPMREEGSPSGSEEGNIEKNDLENRGKKLATEKSIKSIDIVVYTLTEALSSVAIL